MKKAPAKKSLAKTPTVKKSFANNSPAKNGPQKKAAKAAPPADTALASSAVLDRLYDVIMDRRTADPTRSHSARLLSRGPSKVAQKFGEEAVECLIEAVAGNPAALVAESADVLYHLVVMWVASGVSPDQVWAELQRREGISGVAEKASRPKQPLGTRKIP